MSAAPTLAVIAIGRNEGARLAGCLHSLEGQVARLIYVDSGSTDDSVALARSAGAEVVELSPDRPFTAARARAEGFAALQAGTMPDFVQFVDGDCLLEPGWLQAGAEALLSDPKLGLVTGWRSEIHAVASVYNDLCAVEWHRPAGDILTCGGDMMVRSEAYEAAGGFDPQVIAAEDDEFCVRLRKAGWGLRRIPVAMTRHDAAMLRFAQWWRRAVRSGHGFAQVGFMHPPYFQTEQRRVLIYGAVLPAMTLLGALFWPALLLAVLALYALSYLRSWQGMRREGLAPRRAAHHAVFLTLSKFPNVLGMALFHWRRLKGRRMQIIEYK